MARATFTQSTTQQIGIDSIDDLTASLEWFYDLLPITAEQELAKEQARGSLLNPVTVVDGKKNADEDSVKPFGQIVYVESIGPLREAIAMAAAFVESAAPRETGWYIDSLAWFANGQMVSGPPDADRVGVRGNVQLIDLAPYASLVEIDTPKGVIYGAYNALSRAFGKQLSISYGYADPNDYGGLRERPTNPAKRPYAIPVLTIGNPASTVKPGVKARPGVELRKGKSVFSRRGRQLRREGRGRARRG